MKIAFYCLLPAAAGGETPIADVRRVLGNLSPYTKEKFRNLGIKYVRNISKFVGLSWEEIYQSSDKLHVEAFLTSNGYSFNWLGEDDLRVEWIRPAVVKHPVTNEEVWFNHGYFYNSLVMDPLLAKAFTSDNLPFNTFYGNGDPIDQAAIDDIRQAYANSRTQFVWEKGDVLLLDNMLAAHARRPYKGDRSVLVSMFEPVNRS
jgi:hypothetical protein